MASVNRKLLLSAAAIAGLATTTTSFAALKTWDGGLGTSSNATNNLSWNNATNWNADGIPTSADDVTFTNFINVLTNITGSSAVQRNVNSLTFENTATLNFRTSMTLGVFSGNITRTGAGSINTVDWGLALGDPALTNTLNATFNNNNASGSMSLGGAVTNANSGATVNLALTGTGTINLNGAVQTNGLVTVNGPTTVAVFSSGNFAGGLEILAGTVNLRSSERIVDTADVTITGGSLTMQNNPQTETFRHLTIGGTGGMGSTNSIYNIQSLTLNTLAANKLTRSITYQVRDGVLASRTSGTDDFDADIELTGTNTSHTFDIATGGTLQLDSGNNSNDGRITGTGHSLVKTGGGTLRLRRTNTYDGTTTIQDGAILLEGASDALMASNVQIDKGTYGGTGTNTGSATVGNGVDSSDAIISPGANLTAGVGTFTVADLTFATDGAYLFISAAETQMQRQPR
jgi:autotransporter-associated beta strand protein